MVDVDNSLQRKSTRIQFVPDPHSIGIDNPNFTRHSDAVAEFIDNSIQACAADSFESTIYVGIFVQSSRGFLVIADHGQGMNEAGLKNFATFALSKEFRGEKPKDDTERTFIGKFGVGAKQGGFFLGDRIRALTRSSAAEAGDGWLCFTLDAEELIQRQRNNQNVYEGEIISFSSAEEVLTRDELECADLVRHVNAHVAHASGHGAIFVIRMKPSIVDYFRRSQNCQEFERQLADIHYFHLHPAHRPNLHAGRRLTAATQLTSKLRQFEVEFEVFRPGHNHKSNFSEVRSFPRLCFDRAQSSLPFILTVPVENAASQSFDINGIVQYFPFQEGQETRPVSDASDGGDDGIVFRVFWQDRALPEAKVTYLPFLPEQQREISKLVDSGAAAKWKRRLVVFLFLDWKFQCISNNKLKITQADFDVRLKIHKRDILFHPSTLKKDFDKWLVDCSKTFDHEFLFSERVMDLLETRHMIFHAVQALGREGTFARGQKVSVCDTQSKEVVYGVVEDFVVKEHLPIADTTFTGTGTLRYRRVPEVLFGERLFEANLSKIELQQVASTELASYLTDSKPTQIELFLIEPNLKPTPVSTNAPLFRCSVRYALGVKLTRGKNKDTFFPEKAKDFVYGVSLALASDPDTVLARSNELSSNEAESSSSSRSRLKLVVLSDVAFNASGKIALLVRVHSNDFSTQILEKAIDVRCVTTPPKTFAASFVGGAQCPSIRLGSALPSIALVLHDAEGNVIQYDGDLCVCASCDSLDVQGGDFSRGPQQGALTVPSKHWQLMPSSRRAHLFEAKSAEGICGRIVSVLLEASVRPLGGPSQSDGGWKSIGSCSLSVELHPGAPKGLLVLAPEVALQVKCGEIVSRLVVGCADQWGNATAPLPGLGDGRWAVTLGSGPLQPVPKALSDGPANFRSSQRLLSQTAAGARDASDWPIDASGRAELLQLRCSESTLFAQEVVQELLLVDGRSRSALADALRLAVTVLPECSPNALQLSLNGSVIDERFEYAVSAGGVVKGICFQILDENGQAMDLSPYRALEKSHLTIALYPEGKADRAKRKNISLPEANVINAVKAPKSKGVHHLEIAFTLAGLAPLKQIVVIRVQPNAPKAWRIKTSKRIEDGLLMQDADDLASKLEYVFCVDEFDNVTMLPDEAAVLREIQAESQAMSGGTQSFVPPATLFSQKFSANQQLQKPVLRIHAANADASDDLVFTLTRCLAVEGYEQGDEADADFQALETETQVRYLLPPGACIKGLPPESTLHITAESAQDSGLLDIAEHTITAVLVGGDPVALRLFSLSYELDTPAPGAFAVEMSPFDSCDDLEVSVLDEHGGPASSLWTRKTTLRVVELLGPTEERELYAKKNFRKLPHVLRDFVLCPAQLGAAKGRAAEAAAQTRVLRFDMVCGGAAAAGDDSRELSAVLTLRVRTSSHIAELLLTPLPPEDHCQLVRDGDEEKYFLHVTAAQAVPRLAVGLRAADGSQFRVDKSALKASVSPGGWCDAVRLSELDAAEETRLAAEHGCACVFALQVADFNPSRKAGRCTLTLKFDDPRALPPQVPHQRVLGLAIVVAPAPFQELVMNEQRLNKALLHSAVESDRTFAPLLTAQLQDAFGNRISVADDVFLVAHCVPPRPSHGPSQRSGDPGSLVALWERFTTGSRARVDGCGLPLDSKTLLLGPGGELRYPSTPCALTQADELEASQLSQPAAALSGHKRPQSSPSTQASKLPRTPGGEREARDKDGAARSRQEAAAFLLQLGAVAALRRQSNKELAFHYLRLKDADAGFSDGRHEVRFTLIKVAAGSSGSSGAPFDVLWERGVAFDYSSAETVELKSRRVISEGERARAELEEYQTLRNRQRELDDDFTTLLGDIEQDLDQDADSPRLPTRPAQEDLAAVQQRISAALRQLEAQSSRAPVRQTRFLRQRLPEDAVGYVVDLAYVAEQREAEILSWAAGNWIDTIVVQREAVAVDLYQRQQRRAWAFETGGGESRRPGNLPSLERIGQEVGGNPRYMIDVLQLDVGREELRYHLFANVFQNFILVDTLQHALDLRRALRSRGANRSPTMYTLAGDRIPSSGQLDPTNRLTSELQAVFGSQDARQTPRYQRWQRILADTERVLSLRAELDDVEARLRDFDVKQLEQLVREADVERRRLRVT